jgi:hypothetical protein
MIFSAPLYSAVAIVEVARNTSMITTMLLFESGYRSNKIGDNNVLSVSFLLILQIYGRDNEQNKSLVFVQAYMNLYLFCAFVLVIVCMQLVPKNSSLIFEKKPFCILIERTAFEAIIGEYYIP